VAAAIGEVVPSIATTELTALTERPDFDPERWAEDLRLFFDEVARSGCRLILDNAETIADAPGPMACVRRLIDPGSEKLRLMIGSRRAPDVPLQRLVAEQRALVLREADLAFDLAEYREAAEAHGIVKSGRVVEEAWERSGGWCVMLGLGGAPVSAAAGAGATGAAYLEEEVLGRLPAALRDFLTRTSVLDVVTPSGLGAIGLDTADFGARLAELGTHGVPHLPVGEEEGVRVHPLIRERFLAELRSRGEAGRLAELAAEHYRHLGRYEAVVQVLTDLHMEGHALEILHADWESIEQLNLQARVEDWLGRLGSDADRSPERVALHARYLRFIGDNRRLADLLAQARDEVPSDSPLAAQLWAFEVWAATNLAEGPGYDVRAEQWKALRAHASQADIVFAEFSLANAALYDLKLEAGMAHIDAVLATLPADAKLQRVNARVGRAVVLHELGRSLEALAVQNENIEESIRHEHVGLLAHNMVGKAGVLKDLGRWAESLATIEACLDTIRRGGVERPGLQSHLTRVRGECWWHLGRRREALAELERACQEFQDHNRLEGLGTGVLIDHWTLVSGGTVTPHATAADFAERPVCEPHVRFLVHRGRLEAMRGRHEESRKHLAAARDLAHEMPAWQATAWLTEAWAGRNGARREESRAALAEGLARLDAIGAASYPMADPALSAWVVTEAVAADIEPAIAGWLVRGVIASELAAAVGGAIVEENRPREEVVRLVQAAIEWRIRGFEDAVRAQSLVPEALRDAYARMLAAAPLPPLQIRMLGPLEVIASGQDVRFTRKASRAVLEMLLIDAPRPVHEERLLAAIWPDAAPKQATRSLQTAVNELRKALDPFHRANGPSYVRFEDEHYVLQLPQGTDVDLHRFRESVQARVSEYADGEQGESWRVALGEALALWRGELLADAPYAEHAMEERERMRSLFLEGSGALAQTMAEAHPRRAIQLLERALEVDPFWSEGVTLLLACLAREGRVLAAVRWYRAYEARLERELGVPPDDALRKAVEPILGAGAATR
jgi:DNA-binding SARP family transcriptional activator